MINVLQRHDLLPKYKWDPSNRLEFEHFQKEAQRFILMAGSALFTCSNGPSKIITPPAGKTFYVESAEFNDRDGRKVIVIWKNGVQFALLCVKSSKEVGRIMAKLRDEPYSFQRIALTQAYDYRASMAAGRPVLHSGSTEDVGIYVPYPELLRQTPKNFDMLLKL